MSEIRKILDKYFDQESGTAAALEEAFMPIEAKAVEAKEEIIKMKEMFKGAGLDWDKATSEQVQDLKKAITGSSEGGALTELKKSSNFNETLIGGVLLAYANGGGNINKARENLAYRIEKSKGKVSDKQLAMDTEVLKSLNTTVFENGGERLSEEVSSEFIQALRNETVREKLGIRRVNLNGILKYGKMNQGASASYYGETKATPKSQGKYGDIVLSEKKLGVWIPFSNEFRRNSVIGAMEDVMIDGRNAIIERSDLAFLEGENTEYEPKGLYKLANAGNIKTTNGATVANIIADLGRMPRLLRNNKITIVNGGYILHPNQYQALWDTRDEAGWVHRDDLRLGMINGFKVVVSNAVPLTTANKSKIYFADFSKIVEGIGRNLELGQFSEASYKNSAGEQVNLAEQDMSAIRLIMSHDFAAKYDTAISITTDVAWGN